MVQRFDAEAMERKAEGAPKIKKMRTDDERDEEHTSTEGIKSIDFRS